MWMSNRVFQTDISARGISNVIRKLESYRNEFIRKNDELVKRVTELGAETANDAYAGGAAVKADTQGNHGTITAEGDGVVFIEFGAGKTTTENEFGEAEFPFDISEGSYSRENANMYASLGYWLFGGRRYEYIWPRRGMMNALDTMEREAETIAAEVFDA